MFLVAESTFDEEESDDEFHGDANAQNGAKENEQSDVKIIDLENDDDDEASTTFIDNVESDDDESSSYEKKFVRGVATPLGSVTHSSSSSVASPAPTPSIGVATHTTTEEEDDEEDDATNVTLSPSEVVVIGSDTTFVTSPTKASPDMSHVSVVVVGGGGDDVCVMDSSLSSSSSQHRGDMMTPPSRNDVGRSSSSASHSSSLGGPIIPPPKSYSSSISDDDRNNDVGSPCSIILEGTTVDDTEDNDVPRTSDRQMSTIPNGHVDSEEDSGVHVMAKSVDEFQELPHDDDVQKETVVSELL